MASQPNEEKASQARQEAARALYEKATDFDRPAASRAQFWGELWRFVKEAKKSWKILGFNDAEIERAKINKPDWI